MHRFVLITHCCLDPQACVVLLPVGGWVASGVLCNEKCVCDPERTVKTDNNSCQVENHLAILAFSLKILSRVWFFDVFCKPCRLCLLFPDEHFTAEGIVSAPGGWDLLEIWERGSPGTRALLSFTWRELQGYTGGTLTGWKGSDIQRFFRIFLM